MNPIVKAVFEKLFGCRVYRNSLPRGCDLFFDLGRCFGLGRFKTVFDVGANVGQSAAEYARVFPAASIYSFEPVAATYRELEAAVAPLGRVKPFRLAFGATPGEATIQVPPDSRTSSIGRAVAGGVPEVVPVRRVDDFLGEQGLRAVDFMKIDTEGFEIEVLRGAERALREHRVGMLYIEAGPYRTEAHFTPLAELTEHLRGHGYELFGVYEQQPFWDGRRSLLFFNPVFIAPELADAASGFSGELLRG
jgi:FkbM family methyltransferase